MVEAATLRELSLRVRLTETDSFGVVFYANYFVYFYLARLELFRSLGITQEYLAKRHLQFVAAEASCKYHSSAHFDETIRVQSWISDIARKSITIRHKILGAQDGHLLVEGKVTDVLVDERQKPAQIPGHLTQKLAVAHVQSQE